MFIDIQDAECEKLHRKGLRPLFEFLNFSFQKL